jgi:solute carrier family 25 carnitine/acylcarnitine transporter 20/29
MVFGSSTNASRETSNVGNRKLTFTTKRQKTRTDHPSNTTNSQSPTAVRNSFFAGLSAGISGTLVGHPLDSLKVWMQTGAKNSKIGSISFQSVSPRSVWQSLRSSYAGVLSPLLTVGVIQSINFTVYDSIRRYWYYKYDNPNDDPAAKRYLTNDSFSSIAVSGVAAGAVVSIITQPVMMIKTKQQTITSMTFVDAIKHSMRKPLVGFGTHFFVETANRSIYFVTYEGLKRKYSDSEGNTSLSTRMTAATVAGIACWLFIYPTDVIRSRLYAASAVDKHMNAIQCVRTMYAEHGVSSFFQGFNITLLRAGPVAAVILPVYDFVLEQLNKIS